MESSHWVNQIISRKARKLAEQAVKQERDLILRELLRLETLLVDEEDDFVAIGKQRAYREVRLYIQS